MRSIPYLRFWYISSCRNLYNFLKITALFFQIAQARRYGFNVFIKVILFYQTVPHSYDTMGMLRNVFFVCDQYNGVAFAVDLLKQPHDLDGSLCIEIACWFIGQYNR